MLGLGPFIPQKEGTEKKQKRRTVVPALNLSVLPALWSSLSLEVSGVPKNATQHACQQPGLSLIHCQRGFICCCCAFSSEQDGYIKGPP